MHYSHERCPRAGHGRRAASASAIDPLVRSLLGLHLTVTYWSGPSKDLKQPIVTPKQGIADGPHRRASSAPGTVPCGGAMDMS
ncbi:hypothetical protein DPMN_077313 [Dreissena polymorpha]|uniref:Uncharacterized protein n=1 Tax=Dreissena polymorpha TaxID=45954 RepID=A0A9D4BGI8_DREPO|nr:hypothetical protein DPMN_077313 [Dreissena polymorpha]